MTETLKRKAKIYKEALNNQETSDKDAKKSIYRPGVGFDFGVDQDYIDSFVRDADAFIAKSRKTIANTKTADDAKQYDGFTAERDDLEKRAKRIKAFSRTQKNLSPEATKSFSSLVTNYRSAASELTSAYDERVDFVKGFKSADEYDSAMRNAGYMTKYGNMSRAEREKALNDLKVGRAEDGKSRGDDKALDSEIDFLEYYGLRQGYGTSAEYDEEIRDIWHKIEFGGSDLGKNTAEGKKLRTYVAALEQKRDKLKAKEDTFAPYQQYISSSDYNEGSKYVPSGSDIHTYINSDAKVQEQMRAKEKGQQYAQSQGNSFMFAESKYHDYDLMDEEEKALYNYLYTHERAKANEFLTSLSPILAQRRNEEVATDIAEIGYESPFTASMLSLGSNVISGAAGLTSILTNAASLGSVDIPELDRASAFTSGARAGAGQNASETLNFDIPVIQKNAGEFVYGSLMSLADMGIALGTGAAIGGADYAGKVTQFIMSSEAAANAVYSAHEDGLSGIEVAARGVLAGAVEAITEKYSIESILGNPKGIIKGILTQAFTEGTEEGAATLLNTAVDTIASEIFGHANEIEKATYQLMEEGVTAEEASREALNQYLRDLGTDVLAGALTGALMGGTKEISSAITKGNRRKSRRKSRMAEVVKFYNNGMPAMDNTQTIDFSQRDMRRPIDELTPEEIQAEREFDKVAAAAGIDFVPFEERFKASDAETIREIKDSNAITLKTFDEQTQTKNQPYKSGTRYTVSVEDGKYSLSAPDADGEMTVINDDIDSGSIERRVLDLAEKQKMTPATAQKLLNDYNSQTDVDNYIEEADYVYSMGKAGVPMAEVSRGAGLLSEASREMLYTDGAGYTREIETRRTKAYNKLREVTSGVITRGSFDTTNIKGMKLNASQERNVRFAEALSSLGFNIKVVRGIVSNKKAIGAYNPKTGVIEVDIDSMKKRDVIGAVRGQFMNTLSHEITHQMRNTSAELYAQYRDIVLGGFSEGGNLDSLLEKEIDRLQRTGRYKGKNRADLLDIATDEIVARASENMLRDSDSIQRVIEENRSVGEKILEVITNIVEKLKSLLKEFEGEDSVSEEANLLREMTEVYEEAKAKWSEAFADTVKNISAEREAVEMKGESAFTEDGEMVYESSEDGSIRFNEATYDEEGRDKLRVFLEKQVKNKQLSNEDAADILTSLEDIYDTIHEFRDKFAPYGEWAEAKVIRDGKGNPVFSVVTPNGEYAMNIDFSLVCKKRRMLDAVFNRMIKRGVVDDFALGKEEIVKINDIIKSRSFEIACALCFVDAKRFRQAGVADSFVEIYNGIVNEITPEGVEVPYFNFGGNSKLSTEGDGLKNVKVDNSVFDRYIKEYGAKSVPGRVAKYLKTHPADRKLLSRGDFISTAGFDAVRTQKPDILKLFNAKKGSGGPKSAFSDTQYLNEIIERSAFNAAKAFLVGGVRVQSFSDYIPRLVFDYCQMIADLSAKKLPAHAYSKESLFVKQFGKTGIKINMSLIPKMVDGGVAAGLDADGNYAWADESFDFETAKAIQDADGYTDNCGTICVGVSTEHILKLLADPDIRMVIPYHKSGLNPIVAKMNKIEGFTDYTNFQNTRYKNADGTAGSKLTKADLKTQPNVNDLMQKGMDAKEAAQAYLDWCDENGYVPKFDEFRGNPNYYKLLIDFVAYNKDGAAVPQGAVKMNFPKGGDAFGSMASLIEEGLEADAVTQFAQNEALDPIVDEIEKVLGTEEVLYSEYDDTSMRETLAGALLETAQDDAERSAVEKYQSKAREYDSMQKELDSINREIKQLSFAKGKRNTGRLSELRGQKAVLEKKLQRADKKLLELEATKSLKDVLLRREKQLRTQKADALKKARAEAKAATAAELERIVKEERAKAHAAKMGERMAAEAEIADIKRRAAEREIERRKASARNKAKDRAKNLISYITNQTDKKNVKEGIKGAALEFLHVILKDTGMFNPSEMRQLRNAYANLEKTVDADAEYSGAYDFDIMDDISALEETVSGRAWRDLTLDELEKVNRVTANLRTMIRTENKIFREGRADSRTALAEAAKNHMASSKVKKSKGTIDKLVVTDNVTPVYFFKRIGGVFEKLFNDIVNAQNTAAMQYNSAKLKLDELKEKYNFKKWYNDKATTITTQSGEEFRLSAGQAMYLYAVLKRETMPEAKTNHLRGEGIVTEEAIEKISKKNRTKENIVEKRIPLTDEDIGNIVNTLTDEQKNMADEMVKYLSEDMSILGNQVSMELFGIKKYNEQYYIPLKVASQYRYKSTVEDNSGELKSGTPTTSLKHMSPSNRLQKGASNPIVAADIFDVWAEHVIEMSNYNAFVLPIEAFQSLLNYKYDSNERGRTVFKTAYGENALKYLETFVRDLNGGAVSIDKTGMEKLVALQKKSAVAASVSVWVQQPTSILRAMVEIDPKYLVAVRRANFDSEDSRMKLWDLMKKYAPGVVVTKEMGRFDIGSGASAREFINPDKRTQTLLEKGEKLVNIADDFLAKPAEFGDRIAWMQIWKACEAEIRDTTNLSGEAFYTAVGKRFTEVINKTQVYDSVLSRSGHMRNKNPLAVQFTVFKADPTLTLNILLDAARSGNAKKIARATSVFVLQTVVNAALVSLIYAARDDDEDKTYGEKYVARLMSKSIDELTLLGSIPYISDIVNLAKGNDAERMELSLVSTAFDALRDVLKEDAGVKEWIDFGTSITDFAGIPAKNILRDAKIIPNLFKHSKSDVTAQSIGYAIGDTLGGTTTDKILRKVFGVSFDPNYTGNYLDALEDGNTKKARECYDELIEYKLFKAQRKAEANGERFKRNEAEEDARSSIQNRLTLQYKEAYIAAYERKDTDEMARIKAILRRSGVYKKNISDICRGWVKDN